MIPLYDDNPTRRPPFFTVGLMGACVAMFLFQASLDPQTTNLWIYRLGAIPAVIAGDATLAPQVAGSVPRMATLVTSMFLHGGFLHLAGNLLYLWIFGNNVEDALGHGRFLLFYVVSGVLAALLHIYTNPGSEAPMIGASGAISGVLGAYLLLYPQAKVGVLVPIGFILTVLRLPALAVLILWFVFQFLSSLFAGGGEGGGVAWAAHIGGFLAGMGLLLVLKPRNVPLFTSGQ